VTSQERTQVSRWWLVAILVLAFALRAWNLDWDRGTHLQPDERFWSDVAANVENPDEWKLSEVLDPEKSTLNPRVYKPNYVYGTLPLWSSEAAAGVLMTDSMSWAVAAIDGVGIDLAHNEPADAPIRDRLRFNTGYDVTIIGRLMSALIDTLTVVAVFGLARELTDDRRIGLLAALLQALTVLHIQYSHFLGSEPWVAFFVTCGVWGSVRLARGRGGLRTRIFTAIAVGFAIASKLSGIAAVAAPFAAALIVGGPNLLRMISAHKYTDHYGKFVAAGIGLVSATTAATVLAGRVVGVGPAADSYSSTGIAVGLAAASAGIALSLVTRRAPAVEAYLAMGLLAIVAYRIAQPYDFQAGLSLVFNDRFTADIDYLSDINQGGNWPWVQPLVGRTPLLHPLSQMFLWGMGPGLGAAAVLGVARAGRRFFLGERYWAVPLAVIAAYFVLVSLQFYAIVRYLQPTYPVLTALSAAGLVAAWRYANAAAPSRASIARAIKIAVGLSIGATVFWALAFVNGVYGNTNARLAAGDWMLENLPADAVVSQQSWDDGLPWGQASDFGRITLEPFSFGGDSPERIEILIAGLDQVDYVIETSNKFYDSLPRTPARFPQMTRYYDTLFDGSLGFELVKTFKNDPSLFGITIDDSAAEEAFTLYDHPTVFIWKKTDRFSVTNSFALLNPDRARTAVNAEPKDAFANASMLPPAEYEIQQAGSSFSDVHSFDPSSPVAAVLWYVLIQVVAFAVAPTLVRRGGRAGGSVYGLSKPLAMVLLSLPIWFVVSTGLVTMSRTLTLFALVAMVGFGARSGLKHRAGLVRMWNAHKRTIIAAEVVFSIVFLAVLWLRVTNPDTWHPWRGGEKPMELAYLTAVTGSTTLPPWDPWLAGGSLNYYYMGWFVLAVPIRILGLAPDVGFNLGVATYAALAAVTVFSTAAMLAELARRRSDRPLTPAVTGAFATLIFLVIGNLDGFRQVIDRLRNNTPLSDFDWWDPSRVNKNSAGFEVTEFPSFTVLFADLHPHFMAMPFFGLGLAGAIALIELARQGRTFESWQLAAGLGIGSGFMRMVHTWDFPTFVMIMAGAIVFGQVVRRGPAAWRVQTAIGQLVLVAVAHMVVTAPYRSRNQVDDSGFSRSESVTNLDDWFAHWGLFLFLGAGYVAHRLWERRAELGHDVESAIFVAVAAGLGTVVLNMIVGSVASIAFAALAVVGLLLVSELRLAPSTPHVFVAACLALGFAVMLAVETFTQNADIARLNTVFKFWLQIWHLFAIAGAFAASWILGPLVQRLLSSQPAVAETKPALVPTTTVLTASVQTPGPEGEQQLASSPTTSGWSWVDSDRPDQPNVTERELVAAGVGRHDSQVVEPGLPSRLFAGGLVLLLMASLVYPVLSVAPRQENRIDSSLGPSLDGQLWLEPGRVQFGIKDTNGLDYQIDPGLDRPIIEWLQQNVDGRPTIVEAVGGSEYQWWGRISINAGLPTVLGWRWHQSQQRTLFGAKVDERKNDVAEFYTTDSQDRIHSFLRAYDVSYVIVGSLERAVASPATLQRFADDPTLTRVFGNEQLGIYEVDKHALNRLPRPGLAVLDAN